MGISERLIGGNDHICTPEDIWRPLVEALTKDRKFALDPMTNPHSNVPAHIRITNWRSAKNPNATKLKNGMSVGNGLLVEWKNVKGPIWLNGPYSDLKSWLGKASKASADDPNAELIGFVPVRTSGFAWQQYAFKADAVMFLDKRVRHDGEQDTSPFHQALVYWGPRVERFLDATIGMGTVLHRVTRNDNIARMLRDNRINASFEDAVID